MSPMLIIIVVGMLTAASCALLGCFLVLRRNAMLGDAISHSVLPGIVLAFLLTHSRNPLPMLIGATTLGLLTAWLTELLSRSGRLQTDASIGVTFTWLFAVGVILISAFAGQVDLDQDCVLYGEIAFAPWDTWSIGTMMMGPRPLWILGGVFIANLFFVWSCFKELKITAFDPGLAESMRIMPRRYHYLLMTFVSLTVVAAFESVGAILVIAMLVAPACAAYLLTDRLEMMLALAMLLGGASAVIGYFSAHALDASIAGCMATATGVFFIIALFCAPKRGILFKR